jgi:DNA-binding winged helix-turn-helix (wHTH) protein
MLDSDSKELEKIIKDLDRELKKYCELAIMADKKSKLLTVLRQYSHKNISRDELIHEMHKFISLYYFS